jgi:hypothetical protein
MTAVDFVRVLKESDIFDKLEIEEQVEAVVQALKRYGLISVPMEAGFEKKIARLYIACSEATMPYYQ